MVGNLKIISFSLYYNHIIDDSLTLWSYKWVICFLYFRIPYFLGTLYYLFRHKKSIAWIDFFIINEYYFFHIHRSFLEAKYLLVLHQYEHDLKVTYKVLIDQYHHR